MLRVSHAPWVTEGPRDHRLGAGGGPRQGRGCSDGLPLAHGCGGKGGVHAQRAQRHLSALPCCAPRAGVLRASLSLPRPSAPRTWPPPGRSLLTLPPRPGVPLCEVSPGPKSARSPHAAPLGRARPHTRSAPHPRPSCGPGSEGACMPTTRRPGSASGEGTGTWGSTAVSATTVPSPHPHGAERNLPALGYAKAEGPHEAPGQARAGRSLCLTQAPATPVGAGPRRAPARSPASPRSAASARPRRSVGHTAASRLGTDARNRAQEGRPWHRATEALPAPDASTRESLLGIIKISCLLARDL